MSGKEMDPNAPFRRSTRTQRSPPPKQDDSTILDPNASSCPSCDKKDTVEMVECETCKNWYHFVCVGVDSSVATTSWVCNNCPPPADNTENKSIHSSTSSRRRSHLQLERLAKEKAIQDKLMEEQAKLAERRATIESQFLQKEYAILENMSESEDELGAVGGTTEKTGYVTDWLEKTNPRENVDAKETERTGRDLLLSLGATKEQLLEAAFSQVTANETPVADDLILIPSKHVQFAQPLTSEQSSNVNENTTTVTDESTTTRTGKFTKLRTLIDKYEHRTDSAIPNVTSTDPWSNRSVNELTSTAPTYLRRSNSFSSYANHRQSMQPPSVPVSAQTQTQSQSVQQQMNVPVPASQPSITVTSTIQRIVPVSQTFTAPQSNDATVTQVNMPVPPYHQQMSVPSLHQPIQQPQISPVQQSSTPVLPQQSNVPNSVQQTLWTSNQQQDVGATPFQLFNSSAHYQQYAPMSNYQPPLVSSIASIYSNSNQPPIVSSIASQYANPNPIQQPTIGLNSNTIGLGHQPISGLNISNTGGLGTQTIPGSNNTFGQIAPQLGPNRLQLAARQTMPKEYPKFNGDPEKWSIFYNAYLNTTETCGLSNGENLSRLERCLEEPARKAVNNLLTRPEAVPDIIETLKMLYGRPEASIEAQLRTIKNGPPPKMHKMETFIDFAMSIRNVTSEIQACGMWQYLWNPQLMQELVEKLPYQMRLEWGQVKMVTPNVCLSNLSDWLFLRARTACAVTIPPSVDKKNNKSSSDNHVNAHSKDNNSNNVPKHSTNSKEKCCQICNNKSHNTDECRKFLAMALNDRWETVKSNKLCRICLGRHHMLRCDSKSLCGESGCMVKHHRLLHNPSKVVTDVDIPGNVHSAHQQNKIIILRRYIPVTLHGPNGSLNVIAFLDDGSDMTLVESWVAQKLGITGKPEDLYLKWTAKVVRKEPNSQSITFKISGTKTQDKEYQITDARTVKTLSLPPQTIDVEQMRTNYKFLRRLPIEGYSEQSPKILIGLRDCKLSTPRKIRSGQWNEPIATKTLLGWEIHGTNAPSAEVNNLNFHTTDETSNDDDLHQMVERFFSLENFGVRVPEQTVEALSDKRARQLLESTTKRIGDKFETGLLWKYDNVSLPDSFPMAKKRFESLEKRLERDPDLAVKFRAKFLEYVKKGYVRKLSDAEAAATNERTWYLPLFPVMYPKKPGKIRLVWDGAAKVGNISLNKMLLSGPDLLVSLPGVLYRFRERPFTVLGDIKEMFHQVNIRKEDQDSQRFLYKEVGSSKVDVYVLQVMSFGATCSPSSAQHVKNCNASDFMQKYPKAEEAIRTNTYVDDWLQSFDNETEAETIAKEVRYVHSRGGFEIRNWLSNSAKVSRSLGTNSEDEQKISFDLDESQTERILGMWWNVKQDTFTYSLRYNFINEEILTGARRPTKRQALRTLMSIYDPLGFLAAYLVQLKMILQDIWRTKLGWDEQIPKNDSDNLYARWSYWIRHLPDIERININRHYSPKIVSTNVNKIELHLFVDASELAYATVAYFRVEDRNGVECSLIGGKTKVAPLRPLSVPRMELQAAVLGARFRNTILRNHTLKVERTVIWCDSSTVLSWLRSDLRKYTQYVGVRICEILETTAIAEWRWIPSNMNIADDATKLKDSFSLDTNHRWFTGPDFLLQAEKHWPTTGEISETDEEKRPKYVNTHIATTTDNLSIKFERFHQWKRTMAFVIRFVNNVKAKLKKSGFTTRCGLLTRKELQEGENALYRKAQVDEFSAEISELQQQKVDAKGRLLSVGKTSTIYRYSPYLDHAMVLRMRGRIDAVSNVSLDQKRPIILPTKHQITDLIVHEYHQKYKHQYTETVINEIKQKFMIPRLRALFKRIRRSCQHCKNSAAQPEPPEMSPLPAERLSSFTRPYTFVGIDYAGPYKITQFRRSVKRWIVLFTCLTIRAVYIDMVETLTSDSCIMAIRRFIARNGAPTKFFSDRGTSFIGADNELAKEIAKIDHDLLSTKFTTCYTEWHFNPPYGQHMGGAWERLIGSMKRTLDKILPSSHYPNQETFVTALAEVENIINSRPLTFVSIEPDDQEALTPNHFLKGSSNGNKPPGAFPPLPKALRGNWRYAQQIANEFWNKWVKEYLPMITRRTKWFDNVKPIEVGDQVIIVDESAPRNMWERGVVIETLKTDSDGFIRRVNVRTTDGIYNRPVSKLSVLDIEGPEAKTLTRESLAGGSVTASNDIQLAQ